MPIIVNFSWFFTFLFVTLILGLEVYPEVFEDTSPWLPWAMAVVSGLMFFASILTHEMAHSLIARAYGIPVKGITLFIFGGVSQITRDAARPFIEFVMAFAGPATSVLLAGFFLVLWWATGAGDSDPLPVMWQWLWLMNLGLGAFNLAPGFPMDGGRILRSVLWGVTGDFRKATLWASRVGQGMAYSLMGLGFIALLGFVPFFAPASGLWLVVLGLFLESAARQSWRQTQIIEALRRYRGADAVSALFATVEGSRTLSDVAGTPALKADPFCLFVTEDERVVGLLTRAQIDSVSRQHWDATTVRDVMAPAAGIRPARPEEDAASIIQTMDEEGLPCLPVVENGSVVGQVSREAILRLLLRQRPVGAGV